MQLSYLGHGKWPSNQHIYSANQDPEKRVLACNAILMRIGLIDILINDPSVRAFLDYPKVKDLMNIRLT